jgi:hypothetical protein
MGKMIYAILDKSNGAIYFTDTPRTEEEQDFTELLYTSDIVTPEDIQRDLRPWICLRSTSKTYYHNVPEIKTYLESGNTAEFYTRVYPGEVKSEIERFIRDYDFLVSLGCLGPRPTITQDIPELIYDCDIYNYLSEVYGKEAVEVIYSYRSLGRDEKNFLSEFIKQGTRDKKLGWVEKNIDTLNSDVLDFLPGWYRLSLRTVGNKTSTEIPEYKNLKPIGGNNEVGEKQVKDIFFDAFKLGETYTGQEIKEKIQTIYNELGITKTPKISDLYEYFEITNVSIKSSYRIDLRK